jgi:exopolyphosphatase/guanosine-5'-triphosphate,3'-diphosphate pyrophosphatase
MIVGAIDIGTNTVRLLVTESKHDETGLFWHDLAREMEIARLGEGVNRTRTIKPEAMERTLQILSRYKDRMENLGVERYRAVSTSAMRDAKNAREFIDLAKKRANLDIEVISGSEEGRLTFSGAMGFGSASTPSANCVSLVIDVGGGSTEFIYGKHGEIFNAVSLDFGSVRISEMFFKSDPPSSDEILAARLHINELAKQTLEQIREIKPVVVVAVAGTATQLSALQYEVEPYDPARIHGSILSFTDLEFLQNRLALMTTDERKKLKGMHPKRADVIVAGALILEEILFDLGYPAMVVSEKDILDGIAYSVSGPS